MNDRVRRDGDTVVRPLEAWSASIHGLLDHLTVKGFPAPRLLGTDARHEILTWIDGESGSGGWSKVIDHEGLWRWGHFLRAYHDAVADYLPARDSVWSSGHGTCRAGEIVCHGDFGPWNAVWSGDEPIGLLDWDHARPAVPFFDVAYALEYVTPFRSDEVCISDMGHAEPPDRRRRTAVFCDGYGVAVPPDLGERVAQQQRLTRETVKKLAREGVEPQATWVKEGYLDQLSDRVRFTEELRF